MSGPVLIPSSEGIYFDNTVSGLTAENVKDALDELSGMGGGTPTGTPNTLAYFDALGDLNDLTNWDVNGFGGLIETQSIALTDSGSATSRLFNQRSIAVLPTANISTDYLYGFLDQVDLTGTFDYNGYTHEETIVQQSGQSDILLDTILNFRRLHLGIGGLSTSQTNRAIKGQIRTGPSHTSVGLIGLESEILMDGLSITGDAIGTRNTVYVGGIAEYAYGITQTVQTAGDVNQVLYGFNQQLSTNLGATTENVSAINSSYSGDVVQSYTGLNMSTSGDVGNGVSHINLNSTFDAANGEIAFNYYFGGAAGNNNFGVNLNYDGTVTGGNVGININDQSIATGTPFGFNYTRNGTSGSGITVINTNLNSASAVTGDLRHITLYAEAPVSQNGSFLNCTQNGDVVGSWNGVAQTIGADIGELNFHSDVVNNSAVITGDIYGHSLSVDSSVTVTGRTRGWSLANSGVADGIEGFVVTNSANLGDQFRGLYIGDTGDSRTKTAIDIVLSGAVIDDARGLRVNVSGLTMASQRATSASFEGGQFGVQGAMTPFSSLGVDVGNNISMASTVLSGSPLTGTDQIITLIQSNLIAQDDIATGPFGLDTNMVAMPSQIEVASGKTVPLLRSLLLGTSVPSGSGGTITEHVVLELLGLPSFGGSVTCPTKIGLQDSALLGQNFSDGATDAWFIRNQDPSTENHLSKLAIGTSNKKVSSSAIALEIVKSFKLNESHLISNQATSPTVAANAGAGTGATVSVSNATDVAGKVSFTSGTLLLGAGSQLTVTFDQAYSVAPIVILTPADANASVAEATLGVYVSATTTTFDINLNLAAAISTTYVWNYTVIETQ